MAIAAEQIIRDALALPEKARAELAHALILSLDETSGETESIADAWETEVERRADRAKQGAASGRPADEVFQQIRARFDQ